MDLPIPAVPAVTRARFPLNSFAINGNLVDMMIRNIHGYNTISRHYFE
jgi:hypothetical protein